jgi:leucyl-tRNA synthetase
VTKGELKTFLILLNPFAPHITEEMYQTVTGGDILNKVKWPVYDEALCKDDEIEIVVQINGKVKSKLVISAEISKEDALTAAKNDEKIKELINGKQIIKEIYVPKKLVNFVVK